MIKTMKATVPATVSAIVQSNPVEMDLSTFHADTLAAIVTYGARRMMQDSINAQAAAHRKDKKAEGEFDVQAAVKHRLEQFVSGTLSTREASGDTDPLDEYRIRAARMAIANNKEGDNWKLYSDIPSDEQGKRREFLLALAADNADAIDPLAVELKKIADEKDQAKGVVSL